MHNSMADSLQSTPISGSLNTLREAGVVPRVAAVLKAADESINAGLPERIQGAGYLGGLQGISHEIVQFTQ